MRKSMTRASADAALDRVLAGLEKELIEATDEEIEQAAADLGMNVRMKGSAAFVGVIYTYPKRLEDIFDIGEWRSFLSGSGKKDRDDKH